MVLSHASAVLNGICFKNAIELIHYKHLLEQSFDCICVFTNTISTNLSQIEISADFFSRQEHRAVN